MKQYKYIVGLICALTVSSGFFAVPIRVKKNPTDSSSKKTSSVTSKSVSVKTPSDTSPTVKQESAKISSKTKGSEKKEDPAAFKEAMRKLWAAHVIWTREYVVSALAQAEDTQAIAERLLKNQEDIGNAIIPYYGKRAGQELAELLKKHILIAVDLVNAARTDDKDKLKKVDERWHENATDIAQLLSKLNYVWVAKTVGNMLNEHLRLTTKEVKSRLKKNWKKDIQMFDKIFDQAMDMADALSSGIIRQFPEKFKS